MEALIYVLAEFLGESEDPSYRQQYQPAVYMRNFISNIAKEKVFLQAQCIVLYHKDQKEGSH